MQRLQLPQVTLCAVDGRSPRLAAQALQLSMAQVDFARVLLLTHGAPAGVAGPGIEVIDVGPIDSGAAYSHLVLRQLPALIDTPYVLVTQWDGFVRDARAWRPEFLDWDYIGAPWPEQPESMQVGNGGFSLRSQRLLQAGLDPLIADEHPEDVHLCRTYRAELEARHGLRFAPPALAQQFAFENSRVPGPCFGFHGPYNLPLVLDEATLQSWLAQLPDAFFRSRDARRLARALLARRMPRAAQQLIARRQAAGRTDPNTRLLGLAARALRWVA